MDSLQHPSRNGRLATGDDSTTVRGRGPNGWGTSGQLR